MEEDEVRIYGKYVKCPVCNGSGYKVYHDLVFGETVGSCPECKGTGKILEIKVYDTKTPVHIVRVAWGY